MKKALNILSLLTIFAVTSCTYTPNDVNPFSDDEYKPIGLNAEFFVTRSVNAEELYILQSTIEKSDSYSINFLTLKSELRDYTLSRTGVFKNGYDCYDEKTTYIIDSKIYKNNVCNTLIISDSTKHYAFADEISNIRNDSYLMRSDELNASGQYNISSVDKIVINNSTPTLVFEESFDKYDPNTKSFSEACGLEQTLFLDSLPNPIGVDTENNLIFASEKNVPYGTDGIFENKNGERYRAMTNSFNIVKMSLRTIDNLGNQIYMIDYFRQYQETVITSEIIQPNARIEYLEKPILIRYQESILSFDIDNDLLDTDFNKNLIPTVPNGGNENE